MPPRRICGSRPSAPPPACWEKTACCTAGNIPAIRALRTTEKYHGTYTAAPLQQDGKIITANGAGNAMTFALYLLAALQGEEKALEVGRSIQMKL